MSLKIFEYQPEGFKPLVTVVGCYCTCQGKVLLVKRHPEVFSGGKWCLPGGKLEIGESREEGARRELKEEVGIEVDELKHLGTVYLRFPDYEYDFAIYHAYFESKHKLEVDLRESSEAKWLTHEDSLLLLLIHGGERILEYCKKYCSK